MLQNLLLTSGHLDRDFQSRLIVNQILFLFACLKLEKHHTSGKKRFNISQSFSVQLSVASSVVKPRNRASFD